MAKSKKSKADDEDLPEEVEVEEEVAQEEEVVEEEDAPLPDEDEPARDVEDAEDEDEDEEEEDDSPPAPKPKLTKTQLTFMLLNWLAVPAFLFIAYLDHTVHLQYAYRTILNYTWVYGLPLKQEEDSLSASTETRRRIKATPEQLKEAFQERKGVNRSVPMGSGFVAVDEPQQLRLRPSDMTEKILKDVFWDQSPVSATLEDEIDYQKKTVPAKIKEAADAVAAKYKSEDEKRAAARRILLPLAASPEQVEKLDKKIADAKEAALDQLLTDSVQRRIYYDILAPVDAFQPGDPKNMRIDEIAVLDPDAMKAMLMERLDAAVAPQYSAATHFGDYFTKGKTSSADAMTRDSIEKRSKIGFIMFTLGQVRVPEEKDKLLFPKGSDRAQIVCGVYEFTNASIQYVRTLRELEDKVARRIEADRQGWVVKSKDDETKLTRTPAQIDAHKELVDNLVKIAADIEGYKRRREELKVQLDKFQKLYDQRAQHYKDTVAKLLTERKTTEKYVKELREYQETLFRALLELSDAADRNIALEARIRRIETDYMNALKKGGKKQP